MKFDRQREELYYFEGTRIVFTPEYHIERGHCCGNGCRHCPYVPKHQKNNTQLDSIWEKINRPNTKK